MMRMTACSGILAVDSIHWIGRLFQRQHQAPESFRAPLMITSRTSLLYEKRTSLAAACGFRTACPK